MSIGAAADANDKHRELQSSPTYYPTYAPNESSMVDASATTATGATMSTTSGGGGGGGVSSSELESWMVCPEYSATPTQLNMDQLAFYHSVALAPEGDSRIGLLCGKLELNDGSTGSGYIGFGISPDGEMSESVGIVGLPDTGSVEKYWLMDGYVERMSDDKQTLLYTTISQDEDGTPYMEFAKFLYEEEELPILANGDNTFLFALGESSELAYHSRGEGSFTLDLETPASNATTTSDATVTGATSTLTASTTFGIEGETFVSCEMFLIPEHTLTLLLPRVQYLQPQQRRLPAKKQSQPPRLPQWSFNPPPLTRAVPPSDILFTK